MKGAVASCAGAAGADARATTEGDDDNDEGADVDAGDARRKADIRPARMDAIVTFTAVRGGSGESAEKGSARGAGISTVGG